MYRRWVVSWCGKSPAGVCWGWIWEWTLSAYLVLGCRRKALGHALLGLEDRWRVVRWTTALSASDVVMLKLWGTMVRMARVGEPVVATVVVVATRGVFAVVRRRRRACVFAANMGRTMVRLHATLTTAVGFAIVAKLAKLGDDTATINSVDERLGAVL